jgi:hypothetical protein
VGLSASCSPPRLPAVEIPETRYARSGDVSIAYQVFGEGPFDLVYVPGATSHVDPSEAGPRDMLVSQTVKDLVAGSGIAFESRGGAELKGVPGEWQLYAVADA